jgi:hypothetical protein
MQLKNLNPYAGFRQITSGYICLSRLPILTAIKNKKIKPGELGYFIIFLLSADWDTGPHRKGLIRYTQSDLSKMWGIPLSTLNGQLPKSIEANLIEDIKGAMKIVDFDQYTPSFANKNAKNKMSNEELQQLFPNMFNTADVSPDNNEISETLQSNEPPPFRDSFKVSSKDHLPVKELDILYAYTREEWEQERIKDSALPSWENKLLIDESLRDYSTSYYEGYSDT